MESARERFEKKVSRNAYKICLPIFIAVMIALWTRKPVLVFFAGVPGLLVLGYLLYCISRWMYEEVLEGLEPERLMTVPVEIERSGAENNEFMELMADLCR